ncbi:hypothetical protein LTR84_003725 [Exophiala bonariae]|uniref:Uncharacterized protein n=1 Tax=Exophiala bonariae TaxID=1690606 RepID=A0AAV9N6U7_9EURO|nr:hypothetical protein LTR84_003725 [Exophiala bonariae]
MPWQRQKYNLLPSIEDKQISDTRLESPVDERVETAPLKHPRASTQSFWMILSGSVLLTLTVIALTSFIVFKYAVSRAITKPTVDQCGSTPAEARNLGCIFETTLSLWVPPECYDFELETTYLQQPGLKFYRDVNLTEEVSLREVKTGESIGWFVPWDHHVRHCSFAFRKLHRAAAYGKKIDGYVLQYAHTEHCLKMMTEPEDWRSSITQFDMRMFPYCGKEGGFNVNSQHRGEWTG